MGTEAHAQVRATVGLGSAEGIAAALTNARGESGGKSGPEGRQAGLALTLTLAMF